MPPTEISSSAVGRFTPIEDFDQQRFVELNLIEDLVELRYVDSRSEREIQQLRFVDLNPVEEFDRRRRVDRYPLRAIHQLRFVDLNPGDVLEPRRWLPEHLSMRSNDGRV